MRLMIEKNTSNRETGCRPAIEVDVGKINSGGAAANRNRSPPGLVGETPHDSVEAVPSWNPSLSNGSF
jgi:hypothetical protein